ncbi:Protein of unknown function [Cotesia congregata]|uniref:Uncharacterized protein n=1 Tax=Cotesia congregata TaxID=51543 RepID=A0A8J2EP23_COTCN|nr:Protein of unknown function [Cotesia congregata]
MIFHVDPTDIVLFIKVRQYANKQKVGELNTKPQGLWELLWGHFFFAGFPSLSGKYLTTALCGEACDCPDAVVSI